MSKNAFAGVVKEFADEAVKAFHFLVSGAGGAAPEFGSVVMPVVAFASHGIRYRVMLDTDDKVLLTRIDVVVGEKRLVAELEDLIRAAGLGSANQASRGARTLYELRKSLLSQAEFISNLRPRLESDQLVPLMRAANAREWNAR